MGSITVPSLGTDTQWESLLSFLSLEEEGSPGLLVKEIAWAEPGERGGIAALRRFVGRLDTYDVTR
jgi:hypothetical protein